MSQGDPIRDNAYKPQILSKTIATMKKKEWVRRKKHD
jgi:hypothetical protein